MITEVRLRNFKCFEEIDLPLAPLTLLSGGNGAGKSTVLQSLLLLRQSAFFASTMNARLILNGEFVQLGSLKATLRADAPMSAAIDMAVAWDDGEDVGVRLSDAQTLDLRAWADRPPVARCRYVSAERIGPRASFETSDMHVRTADDIGARGEFAAHYLAVHGKLPIAVPELHFRQADVGVEVTPAASANLKDEVEAYKLKDEVEAWLGLVVPGVRLEIDLHEAMDVVWLGFTFPGPSGPSDPRRPTHVGFALTYVLPIVVAVLSAKPGSLVIIENPEAHLHPRAQRLLVQLFARAARAGIQIIVETHSDHVLNGARLAVRKKLMAPDQVGIRFFSQGQDGSQPVMLSPVIHPTGALSEWPPGFFDEWDRALDELLT